MRAVHVFAMLLGAVLAAATALAGPVQVDVQALAAHPDGKLGDVEDLSDLFDLGLGVRGDVLFGLNEHVYLGAQGGWYRSGAGEIFDNIEFDLDSYPVQALFQVRAQKGIGFYGQGGVGFTHQSADGLGILDGSQNSFSWLVGGGLILGLPGPVSLTAGVDYSTLEPGNGDLWQNVDHIRFWLFSAGVRFHTK